MHHPQIEDQRRHEGDREKAEHGHGQARQQA
jgi:hypothetical protein